MLSSCSSTPGPHVPVPSSPQLSCAFPPVRTAPCSNPMPPGAYSTLPLPIARVTSGSSLLGFTPSPHVPLPSAPQVSCAFPPVLLQGQSQLPMCLPYLHCFNPFMASNVPLSCHQSRAHVFLGSSFLLFPPIRFPPVLHGHGRHEILTCPFRLWSHSVLSHEDPLGHSHTHLRTVAYSCTPFRTPSTLFHTLENSSTLLHTRTQVHFNFCWRFSSSCSCLLPLFGVV